MKPKPFASLNHFTFPVAMTETFLWGSMPLLAPAVIAVLSADIDGQTKTPRELDLAAACISNFETPTKPTSTVGRLTRIPPRGQSNSHGHSGALGQAARGMSFPAFTT